MLYPHCAYVVKIYDAVAAHMTHYTCRREECQSNATICLTCPERSSIIVNFPYLRLATPDNRTNTSYMQTRKPRCCVILTRSRQNRSQNKRTRIQEDRHLTAILPSSSSLYARSAVRCPYCPKHQVPYPWTSPS